MTSSTEVAKSHLTSSISFSNLFNAFRYLPMHKHDINVISPQVLQTILQTDMQTHRRITCIITLKHIRLLSPRISLIPRRILSSNHHLVSVAFLLHPFPDELFRSFGVVHLGGVDEVNPRESSRCPGGRKGLRSYRSQTPMMSRLRCRLGREGRPLRYMLGRECGDRRGALLVLVGSRRLMMAL